jgi:hypothetical protein
MNVCLLSVSSFALKRYASVMTIDQSFTRNNTDSISSGENI